MLISNTSLKTRQKLSIVTVDLQLSVRWALMMNCLTTVILRELMLWKSTMEKHCVLLVNKCLVGALPLYFKDYFMLRSQSDSQLVFNRCTRSSITDTILPKSHLDVGKKSFYYHGASLFNSLPMNVNTLSPIDRFHAISVFYF